MWYFMLHSGAHDTIAGVLLAFVIPFGDGSEKSSSYILQYILHHKPVAFFDPADFRVSENYYYNCSRLLSKLADSKRAYNNSRIDDRQTGRVFLLIYIGTKLKFAMMPAGFKFVQIIGAGLLGGLDLRCRYQ